MKKNNERLLSQKTQAVINLTSGVMIILMVLIGEIGKMQHSTVLNNISKILFPFALGAFMLVFGVVLNNERQRGDELSKELMHKAGSLSIFFEVFAVLAVAIAFEIMCHLSGNYQFSIETNDILMFGTFLCGVNLAARSGIFLWLDRTPRTEEDE